MTDPMIPDGLRPSFDRLQIVVGVAHSRTRSPAFTEVLRTERIDAAKSCSATSLAPTDRHQRYSHDCSRAGPSLALALLSAALGVNESRPRRPSFAGLSAACLGLEAVDGAVCPEETLVTIGGVP